MSLMSSKLIEATQAIDKEGQRESAVKAHYRNLADAMWQLLRWLKAKADSGKLEKTSNGLQGCWAGQQVRL